MRRSLAVLAATPLLLATTCIERYELRASPRPERGKPAITAWRGDRPVVVNGLTVQRCRPAALPHVAWSISRKEVRDSTAAPEPIIYGELPKGFAETHTPEPLAPATCYDLVGDGGAVDGMGLRFGMGHGGFHVREDGSVVPGEAGFDESTHYERQFSRAAIACRRALRRARTPGQLAAVDARTFAIADTSVTCELMRTRLAEPMRSTVSTEKAALAVAALVAGFGVLFWLDDVVTRTLHLPKN